MDTREAGREGRAGHIAFNGAMTFQPWILSVPAPRYRADERPLMEP